MKLFAQSFAFAMALEGVSSFALTAFTSKLTLRSPQTSSPTSLQMVLSEGEKPIIIGVAADSGCGKSTFMRRLTSIFGGEKVGPLGGGFDNGGWETNTLVSDLTTVICLDDYHLNDRAGRKVTGLTALHPKENNFDLMYEQLKALKKGETIQKPIYNHVNGTLDDPETIKPTPIIIIEGLHPMWDPRVRSLLDFSLYLDISDEVKLNWKIQRDMEERGHSLESILESVEARKPDFNAYVAPQKEFTDICIEVLPTELDPDDQGETLRVRMVQKQGVDEFDPVYIFDEGSEVQWTPCGTKLTCSFPGIKFASCQEMRYGREMQIVEMDGKFDNIQELVYVESAFSDSSTRYMGELAQAMLALATAPGSDNGTGLMQTLAAFKIRDLYERKKSKLEDKLSQPYSPASAAA